MGNLVLRHLLPPLAEPVSEDQALVAGCHVLRGRWQVEMNNILKEDRTVSRVARGDPRFSKLAKELGGESHATANENGQNA